ncbi:N-ethylammeline chlorohydrolase [Clostridia bacterium]|nr:N-ethylammeline chlorohydrolase [Clostridia bacterium]
MYDTVLRVGAAVAEVGVLENADIGVSKGRIAYIGERLKETGTAYVIYRPRCVAMPGLVNAHTHLPMTLMRGIADDCELDRWLTEHIYPAEDKLTEESVTAGTLLALAEAIASGTTSVSDMYFFCEQIAAACAEVGINANLSRAVVDFDGSFGPDSKSYIETRELADKWHGFDNGRILVDASIHGEYTSGPEAWRLTAEFAAERKLGMHIHLSETWKEHSECIANRGFTPAKILDRYGVFNGRTSAAHCVWVSDLDIELLAAKGVSAVHNPVSNAKLASGLARVPDMLYAGVNVALGTDGAASNNNLDMFEEIKAAAIMHKNAARDPTVLPAKSALRMATHAGAVSQGRGENTGRLEEGRYADIILLDFDRPHLMPRLNTVSNIVYAARGSDVVLNMVRGRILYKDGEYKTIDVAALRPRW